MNVYKGKSFVCPRLQGSGLLQWHVWLPVTHLSFHGQPESSSPFGGAEERSWGDGHGGEGESTLPDPWFHRWKPGRVDPRASCKMWSCVSLCFSFLLLPPLLHSAFAEWTRLGLLCCCQSHGQRSVRNMLTSWEPQRCFLKVMGCRPDKCQSFCVML